MPKRPPTPPTASPYKYFTIHQPFPAEPNLDLDGHRKEVAFWISNVLGESRFLISMYHKPKVRFVSFTRLHVLTAYLEHPTVRQDCGRDQ